MSLTAGSLGGAVLFGADGQGGSLMDKASWAIHVGTLHCERSNALCSGPESLDGQFGLVRHHRDGGRIEIVTDPFGLQAMYVAERDGLTYVSTSALVLAKHLRARPSLLGVEVFLRAGPHFGELTNWEGIKRLPPATVQSHGSGGRREHIYWRPEVDPRISAMGLPAAARECVDVAVATFHDRFTRDGENWCDLTGGYDTRLAALLLAQAGVRFAANTNGARDDDPETVIAARVAALKQWRWERGTLPDDWADVCERELAGAVAWGDGMLEATQLAEVRELQRIRAQSGAALFNGGGGEHWRDYAWKQEIPFGGRTTRVRFDRWVGVRFLHPVDVSVFNDDPTARVRHNLIERCRAYAEPYAGELNSVQLDVLYAYKSMAHFGAYQSAARGTINVELPFYAKPAFLAAFSVAPRHRNSHRLARAAMAMLDKQVAALPTTHGDLATPLRLRNAHRFIPFLSNRARGAARKLTQNLPGPTVGALAADTPEHVVAARRRVLADFAATTKLDPARMRSGGLYDGVALRRLARSADATTRGWATLGRLITVESALNAVDAALE
jgi:asparagine synthase (glutamine-hydrolysing)